MIQMLFLLAGFTPAPEIIIAHDRIKQDLETRQISELPFIRYLYIEERSGWDRDLLVKKAEVAIKRLSGEKGKLIFLGKGLFRIHFDDVTNRANIKQALADFDIIVTLDSDFGNWSEEKPIKYIGYNRKGIHDKIGRYPVMGMDTFVNICKWPDLESVLNKIKEEQ